MIVKCNFSKLLFKCVTVTHFFKVLATHLLLSLLPLSLFQPLLIRLYIPVLAKKKPLALL